MPWRQQSAHFSGPSFISCKPQLGCLLKAISPPAVFDVARLAFLHGPLAFALVGGYGDAAGFILTNTFPGHITGSFVLSAISAASHDWQAFLIRIAGIACFLIGVAVAAALEHYLPKNGTQYLLTKVVAIEIVLVILGYLALTSHLKSANGLLLVCLSLALGLQNGVWRAYGGLSVHTTYFTGMIISSILTETDGELSTARATRGVTVKSGFDLSFGVWLAFLCGAIIGAAAILHLHAVGILGVTVLLVPMLVSSFIAGE